MRECVMREREALGASAFLEGGRLTFAALWWPVCPVKSCHVKTSYSSTLTGASLVSLLSMVEFFAIPQLPDCTPQSAKYFSFCQYYTVDLEDKQLYFPVYIINFSEYYYIYIPLFWYVHSVCSRFEFQVGHLN